MSFPFELPTLIDNSILPQWDGQQFILGENRTKILDYGTNLSGWNDELTKFHETIAGSDHCIDIFSRNQAISQVDRYVKNNDVILEIGCSSGFLLALMKERYPQSFLLGCDVISDTLKSCSHRVPNTPLFRFDLTQCPFPDDSIDIIVMLNVLEHIDDDLLALKQIKRILKPGGTLILEVPAGPHLYDIYDKELMHYRRYKMSALLQLFLDAGLKTVYRSHIGFFLYPAFFYVKKRNRKYFKNTNHSRVVQNISDTKDSFFLKLFMKIEMIFGQIFSFPIGIRCVTACQNTEHISGS